MLGTAGTLGSQVSICMLNTLNTLDVVVVVPWIDCHPCHLGVQRIQSGAKSDTGCGQHCASKKGPGILSHLVDFYCV